MASKNFISDPLTLIDGMCKSLLSLNPALKYDSQHKVVFRDDIKQKPRVTIISGGGSGHEPAHASYVGSGMLDAAVCGAIFASPNVQQILQGLGHVSSAQGTLIIVKNYTGDKLNFGLAAEVYQATSKTPVEMVVVQDDVSVPRSRNQKVGRRGLAGTLFVHKVAGAAASAGNSLQQVAQLAQYVADNVGTIGVSLSHCTLPGQSEVVSLAMDEIELGMGIHNEPGTRKISPQPEITTLIDSMLDHLLNMDDPERGYLDIHSSSHKLPVALLVNNLGALSVLELHAVSHVIISRLEETYQIRPQRIYVGTYLTSLNGPGFSISLLNLEPKPDSPGSAHLLSLLDAPVESVGWTPSLLAKTTQHNSVSSRVVSGVNVVDLSSVEKIPCKYLIAKELSIPTDCYIGDTSFVSTLVRNIYEEVAKQEPDITCLDTLIGDGDCGTTLLSGVKAVLGVVQGDFNSSLSHLLIQIANAVRDAMGGTSGALYGLFFAAFARAVQEHYKRDKCLSAPIFAKSTQDALEHLERYTTARKGSRTLMDALIPFAQTFGDASARDDTTANILQESLKAARQGMEATKNMQSSFGRSTYVGAAFDANGDESQDPTRGIPDPGACGVVAILTGLSSTFSMTT